MPAVLVCPTCRRLDACVCMVERTHAADCAFRTAIACPVALECRHGFDLCPECDPCTCGAGARLPRANRVVA